MKVGVLQGARKPKDVVHQFKLPPASQPDGFIFSADGGKTHLTKSAVSAMTRKCRAKLEKRIGKKLNVVSHSERVSMCYWLDQVWKVPESVGMKYVGCLVFVVGGSICGTRANA